MENQANQVDDFGGIFEQSVDAMASKKANATADIDPDYYRPSLSHKNVKNGVYESLIRWTPNPHDRNLQSVTKWVYFMKNPDSSNDNDKMQIECPSNWGNGKGIPSIAFFELREHSNMRLRDLAKKQFSRREYYWRLCQIVKDEQQADIEGQIRIFRYSKQIEDINSACLNGNPKMNIPGCKYADPFDGRNLLLNIGETMTDKNEKITSYAKSQFTSPSPIIIPGVELKKGDPNSMRAIFDYLKAGSPDLSKAAIKKWDDETEDKVIRSIMTQIDDITIFNKIYKKAYDKNYVVVSKNTNSDAAEPAAAQAAQPAAAQPAASAAVAQPAATVAQPAATVAQPAATVAQPAITQPAGTPAAQPAASAAIAQPAATEATPVVQATEAEATPAPAAAASAEFNIENLNIDFSDIP